MTVFEQILSLNAEAVAMMQDKRYGDAIVLLHAGLGSLGSVAAAASQASRDHQVEHDEGCFAANSNSNSSTLEVEVVLIACPDSKSSTVATATGYNPRFIPVFDGAFLAYESASATQNETTSRSYDFASAVLIYNMGLALHLKCISELTVHLGHLGTVMSLYQMALQLLEKGEMRCRKENILAMACANNMGVIYSEDFELESAGRCIESLTIALAVIGQPLSRREVQSFTRFRLATLFWQFRESQGASAA